MPHWRCTPTSAEKQPAMDSALRDTLHRHGQDHLLQWWPELTEPQRAALTSQLQSLDFEELSQAFHQQTPSSTTPASSLAEQAQPPARVVRVGHDSASQAASEQARQLGDELLRDGRVAVLLVAGGQGTRLDFPKPKGMFPIGPVSGKTLFELLAEQVRARSARAGAPIPYYIMTSDATHADTVAFFESQKFFGLPASDVVFLQQGNMPAFDRSSGQVLLAEKHQLSTSPDGHGGLLAALKRQNLIADMRRRGIEYIFYHQVDNPLVHVAEPEFLGHHAQHNADISTKVVAKLSPDEKMGVVAEVEGQSQMIEYSDLSPEAARRTDANGLPVFWAGNTAIHIFSVSFLERLLAAAIPLPWHRAIKKVPYINSQGDLIKPDTENAVKLERFIFDVLLETRRSLVVEADRAEEFHPLKNKSGEFSPDDVKQHFVARAQRWLESAGVERPAGLPLEISPLYALDEREFVERWRRDPRKSATQAPWHIG